MKRVINWNHFLPADIRRQLKTGNVREARKAIEAHGYRLDPLVHLALRVQIKAAEVKSKMV